MTEEKFAGKSTSIILRNVRDMMAAEKLQGSHPAILSVVYMSSQSFLSPQDRNYEVDDEIVPNSPTIIDVREENLMVWAVCTLLGVFALLVAARGMYARRHKESLWEDKDYYSYGRSASNSSTSDSLVALAPY